MVKVGIIGLGFMGLTHLKVYQTHPRARLVAVADQVKKRLQGDLSGIQGNTMGPGERFDFSKLRAYETVEGILDDADVEMVSVCLPTSAHAGVATKALAKGKHVLCEKPMALVEPDLEAMLAAAKKAKGLLMVAQCIRFWPEYAAARDLILGGKLGAVRSARFERRSAFPTWGGWLGDESQSGGAIVDLSIHDIDFARHVFGLPRSVRAEGHADLSKRFDTYQGTLKYPGFAVQIEGSWYHPGEYAFNAGFDIVLDGGTISFSIGLKRPLTIYHGDGRSETPKLPDGDGYFHEIEYFLRCIEEKRRPERSPPEESAQSVRLALLLKQSRAGGGAELPVSFKG
jgi:predicted dehydrogenase